MTEPDSLRILTDLRERLHQAVGRLEELEAKAATALDAIECSRLGGKLEGVCVALSYVNEYIREAQA